MAWEWVAPTATAISGAIGIYFTHKTGTKQQDSQIKLLREGITLERRREYSQLKRATYKNALSTLSEAHMRASLFVAGNKMQAGHQEEGDENLAKVEPGEPQSSDTARKNYLERLGIKTDHFFAVISVPALQGILAEVQLIAPAAITSQAKDCIDAIVSIGVNLNVETVAKSTKNLDRLRESMLKDLDPEPNLT
ncbi:hypothetical protein [Amycolatopsis japonica]|uniref:hypothetical protein n=1 Tax=Amycolatopsis japonica TaxID=208439 RepID=UPI0011DC9738|nr:hypothetical protein [Amycolatopsis japonica]